MILVDATIAIALTGAAHTRKDDARRSLETSVMFGDRLVTDALTLHEVARWCGANGQSDRAGELGAAFVAILDDVLPITEQTVVAACRTIADDPGRGVRRATHVAVMTEHGIDEIMSFDAGYDEVDGVRRVI